ncbi:DUF488 family protein, N3 subclade [Cellulosilyticum lentocellum]|uniref:Helix-turn-helix domain-containing protein n=1 Tax=Cellulosilyticum lentocellum (strain ATCC 49066 / DSM 5427 / NCIMB 11756 / RHM5) TaxID=642492 RepID=F2JJU1_CELLD|nr:DUF488 family protein [Cellulosilyticum lentocellum]ADZ83223.1 protein of unknown function DUF488 [Cellulosilyticum lentocellum DSM 5427]
MSELNNVITIAEAAQTWDMATSTLRHAISDNKFNESEVKKSGGTWLILKTAMYSKYGDPNVKKGKRDVTTLYTIGYEGLTIESFISRLKKAGVNYILDVREIPLSRKKGFSKNTLAEELKKADINYSHFKVLGSPKDIREKLKATHDYDSFFKDYKRYISTQKETVEILNSAISANLNMKFCLLCFEKDYTTCHRIALAQELIKGKEDKMCINNL